MRYMNADQWASLWNDQEAWRAHWSDVLSGLDILDRNETMEFLKLCRLVRSNGSPKNRVLMHRHLACLCGKDGVSGLRTFVQVAEDGSCLTSFTRQEIRNVASWMASVARKTGRSVYEITSHKTDEQRAVSAFAQKPAEALSRLTSGRATGGLI